MQQVVHQMRVEVPTVRIAAAAAAAAGRHFEHLTPLQLVCRQRHPPHKPFAAVDEVAELAVRARERVERGVHALDRVVVGVDRTGLPPVAEATAAQRQQGAKCSVDLSGIGGKQ